MNRLKPSGVGIALLCAAALAIIFGLWLGLRYETQVVNSVINEVSDLRDPSPFRAALLGHLGRIHLSLTSYLRNPEPLLEKQVSQSRDDFESLLPEFVQQNPKLFPQSAAEEIRRTFGQLKEAIGRTMEANAQRMAQRGLLEKNFARILFLVDHNLRPLIRKEQADGEERGEAVLNIENQTRAWQQNIAQAWTQPSDAAQALTFENDNRGQTFLELYGRMELLPRERKIQKEIHTLWMANSDMARESFVKERIVDQAQKAIDVENDQVTSTLNQILPAMPPGELEKKKQALMRSMKLRLAAAGGVGLLGVGLLIALALTAYRWSQGRPLVERARSVEKTLQMDLQGLITAWSPGAETLYGYTAADMRGQSIGKLFESESEIARLGHELAAATQAVFETVHKTKSGTTIPVRIQFLPVTDAAGHTTAIGLLCTRR